MSASFDLINATDGQATQPPRQPLYFRRCRGELNEGFYAQVPRGYFPVYPNSSPTLLRVQNSGEPHSFTIIPSPPTDMRFFKKLSDGTFVKLPFAYPDEMYEEDIEPEYCNLFFLKESETPILPYNQVKESQLMKVPEFIAETKCNWNGPKALCIPPIRYVLKSDYCLMNGMSEDEFVLVDTRKLKLEK